ncbi:hypothetical protein IQ277_18500 [Nostocales cyanobacterium LEGE 12452]|nr:hypothetical protein [Nostocales cyanobacterium LEGE 12452]
MIRERERSEGVGWIGYRGHNATFALFVKVIFSLACVGVARRRHRFLNILHPDSKLHANYFQSPEKDFQLDDLLVLLDT